MARMGMALSIRAIRAIRGLISRMLARLPSCGCGSAARLSVVLLAFYSSLAANEPAPKANTLGEWHIP